MKFLNDLACPQCQGPFDDQLMFEHEGEECGYLHCAKCLSSTPLVLGFSLFTETVTADAAQTSHLHELVQQMAPGDGSYGKYVEQKFKRNIFEVYAAFQPFNESSRSIYPLVDAWRKHLKPGDLIVDTWCRSGWSGELLASLFPHQRILSIWQGNSSVLGYRGFFHWLNSKRRSPNLEIIFSPANSPFPIRSESAKLVNAYDSLHRNPLSFFNEYLRIGDKRGILCFPHVHLKNGQPDPFFERGGEYRYGQEYKDYFQDLLKGNGRKPMVLSEISMFKNSNDAPVTDDANTKHYNGLILIAEENWYKQSFFNHLELKVTSEARLVPNPLLNVNPLTRKAYLNKQALNDSADYLLGRHPVYQKFIDSNLPMELTDKQLALITVAQSGAKLQECAKLLSQSHDALTKTAQSLVSNEIVAALPLSQEAFSLQQFHANRHTLFPHDFLPCWSQLLEHSPQSPFLLVEGEQLSVEEVTQVVMALCRYFKEKGNASSGKLAIVGEINAERLMVLMAAWCCGLEVNLCDEQNIPSSSFMVLSDIGIPGSWENLTLACDDGKFIDFWTVIEEFSHAEDSLPVRPEKPSVLHVSEREIPWYLVSSLLTPWLTESQEHRHSLLTFISE